MFRSFYKIFKNTPTLIKIKGKLLNIWFPYLEIEPRVQISACKKDWNKNITSLYSSKSILKYEYIFVFLT